MCKAVIFFSTICETPTAHKQSKLNGLLNTYRDGLQETFDTKTSTISATTSIVTTHTPAKTS